VGAIGAPTNFGVRMRVQFEQNGIRYQLLAQTASRREAERAAEDIRPDPSLWHSPARKAKDITGLASEEEILERNKKAAVKRQRAWRRFKVGRAKEAA
jgi:hypothetical protein